MGLSGTTKKMTLGVGLAAMAMIIGGVLVCLLIDTRTILEALFFAIGTVLTSALNVWKIVLLERSIKKTLEMEDPDTGKNYIRFQYLLRYFLTGAVLLAIGLFGYFTPHTSIIFCAVFGLFTMQISIMIVRHMNLDENT